MDLSSEVLVFVKLRKISRHGWAVHGKKIFQPLRESFPILVVGGGVVAFLKRHEHIWANMFRLVGREVVGRYEASLQKFSEYIGVAESVREAIKASIQAMNLPPWLAEAFEPSVSFGVLPYGKALKFLETIRRRFKEYMEAPLALKGPREGESGFHKFLRTSDLAVLVIRGTYKEGMLKYVSEYLYGLLDDGVIPIDYSYDSIIVARKVYADGGLKRFWRSTRNLDPIEVLRGFEQTYFSYVFDVKELEFERRDVGWGLKAIPAL